MCDAHQESIIKAILQGGRAEPDWFCDPGAGEPPHEDAMEVLPVAAGAPAGAAPVPPEWEAPFQSYLERAPLGVFLTDPEGRHLQVNPEASRITGYSREELLAMGLRDLLPASERDSAGRLLQTLGELGYGSGEFEFRHKQGRAGQCSVEAVKLSPARFLAFASDISGRRQDEAERRALVERLGRIQALEALGVLVAGVAHNINNVLGVIMGTASMHDLIPTDPAALKDFHLIETACKRGRSVVKGLLQFAQPSLAHPAPCDLQALVGEVVALLENTTRNRVRIVVRAAPEPAWIHGDAGSLSHALMNLCLNAVDAMAEGGVLTLGTAVLAGNRVAVSVADDGAGMSPEILDRALEPFFTTKPVGKGTGLGLSMTFGVVKAHGGTLEIASRTGQGTTVTLRFPRIPAPVPEEVAGPAPGPEPLAIFLVDDDEDVRILMGRMLALAGAAQVRTFAGGEAVLAALQAGERPGLVILDQNMPGLDGTQTLALIRDLCPDLPILISSGQPDIETWECFRRPGLGVIAKPFTMEEIRAKLAGFAASGLSGRTRAANPAGPPGSPGVPG